MIAGFDYATQQKAKGGDEENEVLSPVLIAQYKLNTKLTMAGRVEYYRDKDGIVVAIPSPNGFRTTGYSVNFDYSPISSAVIRLEGKIYNSKDKIFSKAQEMTSNNGAITASIAVSF